MKCSSSKCLEKQLLNPYRSYSDMKNNFSIQKTDLRHQAEQITIEKYSTLSKIWC